jgi:hypothetical protein
MDNAPAHNLRITQNCFGHNPLTQLLHPLYFPDVTASHFYLFGKVKSSLIWRAVPDEIDLLEGVTKILNHILGAKLQRVFRSEIERVQGVIDARGGYLTL